MNLLIRKHSSPIADPKFLLLPSKPSRLLSHLEDQKLLVCYTHITKNEQPLVLSVSGWQKLLFFMHFFRQESFSGCSIFWLPSFTDFFCYLPTN